MKKVTRVLTLGDQTKATFIVSLEALIDPRILPSHDVEHDLWRSLDLIANSTTEAGDHLGKVLSLSHSVDDGLFVLDLTTVGRVSVHECDQEFLDLFSLQTIMHNANTPCVEGLIVGKKESLLPKIPTPTSTRCSLRTSILDLRGWEKASVGLEICQI